MEEPDAEVLVSLAASRDHLDSPALLLAVPVAFVARHLNWAPVAVVVGQQNDLTYGKTDDTQKAAELST